MCLNCKIPHGHVNSNCLNCQKFGSVFTREKIHTRVVTDLLLSKEVISKRCFLLDHVYRRLYVGVVCIMCDWKDSIITCCSLDLMVNLPGNLRILRTVKLDNLLLSCVYCFPSTFSGCLCKLHYCGRRSVRVMSSVAKYFSKFRLSNNEHWDLVIPKSARKCKNLGYIHSPGEFIASLSSVSSTSLSVHRCYWYQNSLEIFINYLCTE